MSNFRGYSNSRASRMERRKALKESYEITQKLKVAINGEPEAETKRPVLSLNRKHIGRVEKAISVRSTPVYDSSDNCCLSNAAVYSTTRHQSKPKTEFGITARA